MMKRMLLVVAFLLCLGGVASARGASAQESVDVSQTFRDPTGFSLDIAVASVARDGLDVVRPAVGINPRWCWRDGGWCWWVDIWWIIGPRPDPWAGFLDTPFGVVPLAELELGDSLMAAPVLEYSFATENRLRPSLFAGFGVQRDSGATTEIAGVGDFRIPSNSNPVALYGGALTYDLNQRSSLRVSLGGSTTFVDDMVIEGPQGSRFEVEGGDVSSAILSVGLTIGF